MELDTLVYTQVSPRRVGVNLKLFYITPTYATACAEINATCLSPPGAFHQTRRAAIARRRSATGEQTRSTAPSLSLPAWGVYTVGGTVNAK